MVEALANGYFPEFGHVRGTAAVWSLSPLWQRDLSLLKRLDVLGLLGLALFLGGLEYVLEEGPKHDWLQNAAVRTLAPPVMTCGLKLVMIV